MKKICRKCFEAAKANGLLENVKALLRKGCYICPRLDPKCGNTADFIAH